MATASYKWKVCIVNTPLFYINYTIFLNRLQENFGIGYEILYPSELFSEFLVIFRRTWNRYFSANLEMLPQCLYYFCSLSFVELFYSLLQCVHKILHFDTVWFRPHFYTLYLEEPDSSGHSYGPVSSEVSTFYQWLLH